MLRDLFRRREPAASDPALAAALADLDRLAASHPELAAPARTLGTLLSATFAVAEPGPLRTTDELGLAPLPRFRLRRPRPDAASLRARGVALAEALGSPASALLAALRSGRADLSAWADPLLAGQDDPLRDPAAACGLDPAQALAVLRLALLPALACWSAADPPGSDNPSGGCHCPLCGDPPLLAESRGLEEFRFLRCGLCAASWPADRLRCAGCGESDPAALTTLSAEGDAGRARLVRCSACGWDLKVVPTLAPLSPPALLVADLATIHLDLAEPPHPDSR